MTGFLKDNAFSLAFPMGGSTGFATLTNYDISMPEFVFVNILFLNENLLQIGKVYIKPTDVWVPKVAARHAGVFRFVEHLAEAMLSKFAKSYTRPG
jgi:hypothetical protein